VYEILNITVVIVLIEVANYVYKYLHTCSSSKNQLDSRSIDMLVTQYNSKLIKY